MDFKDFDEFATYIEQGNVDHFLLESGSFRGHLSQVVSDSIIISLHKMNKRILQRGSGVEGYFTFLLLGDMDQQILWKKTILFGNRIGFLKGGNPHSSITYSRFCGTPISLSYEFFNRIVKELGYPNLINDLTKMEAITIDKGIAIQLQAYIKELCEKEHTDVRLLFDLIPRLLLSAIIEALCKAQKPFIVKKQELFTRVKEHIDLTIHKKTSINKLASYAGISERSLRNLFYEKVGVSPKKYISYLQLNMVRKKMKQKHELESVKSIAAEFGFMHSGQFAADYKKLFGELPSHTKK